MRCAEGIPQTEDRVLCVSVGNVDTVVTATIATVDIGQYIGSNHGVIHRRIEGFQLCRVVAVHADPTQFGIPCTSRLRLYSGEVPMWNLGLEVFPCPFPIDRRDANLHEHVIGTRGEAQGDGKIWTVEYAANRDSLAIDVNACHDWARELHHEKDALVAGPSFTASRPFDTGGAGKSQGCVESFIAVSQVDKDLMLTCGAGWKSIVVHACTGGRSYLGADGIIGECYCIVAGFGAFVIVAESRSVPGWVEARRSCKWHYQNVAVVRCSGTTQMGVREAVDQRVGVIVTTATFPALVAASIRAKLHHAVGYGSPRIGMSNPASSCHWVDIAR